MAHARKFIVLRRLLTLPSKLHLSLVLSLKENLRLHIIVYLLCCFDVVLYLFHPVPFNLSLRRGPLANGQRFLGSIIFPGGFSATLLELYHENRHMCLKSDIHNSQEINRKRVLLDVLFVVFFAVIILIYSHILMTIYYTFPNAEDNMHEHGTAIDALDGFCVTLMIE